MCRVRLYFRENDLTQTEQEYGRSPMTIFMSWVRCLFRENDFTQIEQEYGRLPV